jgi:predicted nuclease of predicted toxin-antitoxin system
VTFKIDENLPVEVAELLQQSGHEAATVAEQHLSGGADADIAAVCQREGLALVTLDLDFADIRTYPPEQFSGLIVFRLKRQDKPHVLKVARRLVQALSNDPLQGRLWIVEEGRIRIRGEASH